MPTSGNESVGAETRSAGWLSRVPSAQIEGPRLGALLGLTVGAAVALGAVGDLLTTMRPPDVVGRGIAQGFGTNGLGGGGAAASATLETWRTFDALRYSDDLLSAFTVAEVWLALDTVFLVLYALSVLALARPGGALATGGTPNTLAATRLFVLAVAAADAIENSIASYVVAREEGSDLLFSILFGVRSLKLFVLATPLVALLLLLALRKARLVLAEPRARQALVMARAQILVVAIVTVVVWYGPSSDVMLDMGTSQAVSMMVFGGLLCAGLGIGARVLIDRDRVGHRPRLHVPEPLLRRVTSGGRRETVGGMAGLLIAALLAIVAAVTGWGGLFGAAVVFLAVVVASWLLQDSDEKPAPDVAGRPTARLPAVLGLAPVALVGIALIHWTLWADIVLSQPPFKAAAGLVLVAAAGALIPHIGAVAGAAAGGDEQAGPAGLLGALARCRGRYPPRVWGVIVAVLAAPALLLPLGTNAVDVRYLGAMSLVFGAAGVLNLLGSGLVIIADWWRDEFGLPSVFKALQMRRIPVFLLLAGWMLVNAFAFADPSYYDVETAGTNRRVTLEEAYRQWVEVHVADDGAVPLVVVALEGGGLRSAYWTERVLSEVFADAAVAPFALSGASGGSVGIATYLARDHALGASHEPAGVGLADVEDPDFLSALFHRWFTLDLAHAFMRQPRTAGDRARALEEALMAEIPGLSAPYDHGRDDGRFRPVTVFNATDLQDGCLAPISTIEDLAGPAVTADGLGCLDPDRSALDGSGAGFPGAADVAHDCPGNGMTFATAAVASARSPYVTPAGRLENCGTGVFYLGDGGYVDNSGAVAAAVILDRLESLVAADNAAGRRCIVPILIQIDNGAESLDPSGQATGNPSQLTVVMTGALAANNARHDIAKAAAAALVQRPLTDTSGRRIAVTYIPEPGGDPARADRYLRIFPLAQAGRDATVGWLLSQPSKDALETQLEAAIADARALLSPDSGLACGS